MNANARGPRAVPGGGKISCERIRLIQSLFQARHVWQEEYWDRFIRDRNHFVNTIHYIHNNPLKAGLVESADQWPWSSVSSFSWDDFF